MIDGVPLRDGFWGHQGVDEMVPLDMVERIEIIAGPGSVLYGTNAFTGVVSVTTRRAENMREQPAQAKLGYGTYDSKNASVEFGKGPLYVYADYLSSQGSARLSTVTETYGSTIRIESELSLPQNSTKIASGVHLPLSTRNTPTSIAGSNEIRLYSASPSSVPWRIARNSELR